jgi:hypothetical protein
MCSDSRGRVKGGTLGFCILVIGGVQNAEVVDGNVLSRADVTICTSVGSFTVIEVLAS